MERNVSLALRLINDEEYGIEAAQGCEVGNSVVGSLLSLLHGVPRQYAEQAVAEALKIKRAGRRRKAR